MKTSVIAMLLMFTASAVVVANPLIPAPPQISATAYLLMDATSGEILVQSNADQPLPPASLTKMMTSYIASDELINGSVAMDDQVRVSIKAWKAEGSRMFIKEGTLVSLEDLMRGIIIQSGNDASIAVAEHIAGGEDAFADLMNRHAQRLGMTGTNFENATGLPSPNHYTTAADLAILAQAIIRDHPETYGMYAEQYFTYNNIRQPNRNKLLWRDRSVDGLKTGHTEEAGYCLVASAERDGMRLINVVLGTESEEARAAESQKLLTYGFRYFETHQLFSESQQLEQARLWGGAQDQLRLGIEKEVVVTIPRGQRNAIETQVDFDPNIQAPVAVGQKLGMVTVQLQGETLLQSPLVALEAVEAGSFFKRIWDYIVLFFINLIK